MPRARSSFRQMVKGFQENNKLKSAYVPSSITFTKLELPILYSNLVLIEDMKFENSVDKLEDYSSTAKDAVDSVFKDIPESTTTKINVDTSSAEYKISELASSMARNITLKIGNLKADGGILINNKWRDVATYDTGGLPPIGQMFIARERGPELVGTIGGNTAVMNNNQIVSSVSAGVYQAVRGAMGNINSGNGVYNIYLDKDHKLGTYTLEQLQGMARTNGKPITIG